MPQRGDRHGLGPVGDEAQARKIEARVRIGDEQHVQERRGGREQLHAMRLDAGAHGVGGPGLRRDRRPSLREDVQKRVDAADVVEEEEHEGAVATPDGDEFVEQGGHVEERRLGPPGRAGTEEDQPGGADAAKLTEQRVFGRRAKTWPTSAVWRCSMRTASCGVPSGTTTLRLRMSARSSEQVRGE